MGTHHSISEKQLAANRANALKSSGPKTEQGKTRSCRNAFRHGLTGQVSVNTDEDRKAHTTFTNEIIAGLKPQGAIEKQLAFSIADNHWRLNRARAMEDNIFANGSFGPASDINVDHPEIHTALTAANVFLESSKDFERLTLYEQRIHRTLEKDMAKLEALQEKRLAAREAALDEAAKISQVADFYEETEPNGFDFSTPEIEAHRHRIFRLKQHAFHEKYDWNPELEFCHAA